MAYQHKLQIPISEEMSAQLKAKVKELGFSSVSEATRFLLTNLLNGNLSIGFSGRERNQELEEMVAEALEDHKNGKIFIPDPDKPIHDQLMSYEI